MKPILILFLFISVITKAQVVNIEQERLKTDTTGWAGSANISFQFMKSDDKLMDTETQLHLQYKTKKSLYLALSDFSFVKAGKDEYANNGFQHLRYNYKINDWYTVEAFTQAQFNKILGVKFRGLLGAGPRFKVIKTKKFRLYAAWLYMFEYEEINDVAKINRNHRVSSYVSFTWKMNKLLSLVNTTYYQPKINQFNDFKISSQTDLIIKITDRFAFAMSYNHYYNSKPPEGIVNTIYSLENALSFEF